ncbi:MAG: sugar phosphate isomerase/epimerase [Chloroflexi bacterium]|nr:sugar phosphate isomerase/epimerase [Chloroflexota bacterium]
MRLGVIVSLEKGAEHELQKVHELGLPTCQIACWRPELYTEATARELVEASKRHEVEVTTLWAGWSGRKVWNFVEGPTTIGLVPPATRAQRLRELLAGANFVRAIGVPSITTHVGFLPEWTGDPDYAPTIEALRAVATRCRENGQEFWFETGQETPITLLRAIHDIGMGNLGINLDPANLLLYGKANPLDALDVFGQYVRGVHAKDGEYPTDGRSLGRERPLGQGRVNFPALIGKLKALGYGGALTIEREISGPQQIEDIRLAIRLLEPLCRD